VRSPALYSAASDLGYGAQLSMHTTPPLAAAPRILPRSLALRVRLGGVGAGISWLVLAFGGVLATVFIGNSSLLTSWRFAGTRVVAQGEVLAVERTSSRINDVFVQRVSFEFEAPDGRFAEASSYGTAPVPQVAATVEVEWPEGSPELARIVGMRAQAFSEWVGLTLIAPLAGLVGLALSLRANSRRLRLMREGESAWGVLTKTERTNTQINNQYVHRLYFEFVDVAGERRTATDRTHRAEFFDRDVARRVLYDPRTDDTCILELTPGSPAIDNGAWLPVGAGALAKVLLLPCVAAAVIAIAASVQL